ncbi:hypothetical protein AVEN_19723-1 [Araneus ventricosus]|uniref:Uncharacterized protein n=1 Tax=Araneus ventricosus TaxID=182803 RepID=A0A4Y2C2H6_ARAVE|nr:hypothetical protein AVEN_19723-1 [Araneus ventricosus]
MVETNKSLLTKDQPTTHKVMGNLIAEENGEHKYNVELLICFLLKSKLNVISLAVAPSRITIGLLDGDRRVQLQSPLVLVHAENPI